MTFELKIDRKGDKTCEISASIPAKTVSQQRQEVIKEKASQVGVKGFRKGRAPAAMIEKDLDSDEILQALIRKIVTQVYEEAINKHQLRAIIPPKVELVSAEAGKDWRIKITTCELPEIVIDDLEEEIKKAHAKSKIWTPGKDKGDPKDKEQQDKEVRMQRVIELIIQKSKLTLPEILMEYELNQKLVGLVDQAQDVGLKIDQYLASKKISLEQLKDQYRRQIEANWKVDLALEKIADQRKIVVSEEETKKYQGTKVDPYLAARIIRRDKTLEYLANL